MKTIKIIDLLNKIANDKEMPEKIFIYSEFENGGYKMELSSSMRNYKNDDGDLLFSSDYNWLDMLNYDVEIIEETKNLSKIKWEEKESLARYINDKQKLEILARRTETLKKLLNEIIDKLNEVE